MTTTHPTTPTTRILSDRDMTRIAARHIGSVPARVEFRWPVADMDSGTARLLAEGQRRLSALGDRFGFTVVAAYWDFEERVTRRPGEELGSLLCVVARVLWWPPHPVVGGAVRLVEQVADVEGAGSPGRVHGTRSGYVRHRRHGEAPCVECREAVRVAAAAARAARAVA